MENINKENKGFTKTFNSGKWYMVISNEKPMTNDGKTCCKFDLISNKNSFWGCPVNQFGTMEEILETLKGWLEIDQEERFSNLKEINKDMINMEKEFISILENELSINR